MSDQVSDLGLGLGHGRRHRPRRSLGCLAVLVSLAVLLGGGYLVYAVGITALRDRLSPPADYDGSGTGRVLVEVKQGDAASDIGSTLRGKDVVKSVEAFTDAARDDERSVGIQVGFYELRRQMSAKSALSVLIDPSNRMRSVVTVPEGLRVDQIVALLVRRTDFSTRQFDRVLARPRQLGLPSYAGGKAEGYLFPATYELAPNATPRSILSSMVRRYAAAADDLDLVAKARALGRSPHEVMTVASIVQAEGRLGKDFPKIARVLYNRLDKGQPLQLDTTIVYIFKTSGKLTTTGQQRSVDSPYNTYRRAGLPPTPISAPGQQAIEAALRPATVSWLYF
ncbi:MAG: endolytic transglycosylase MltG, partial [Nocardioidaceae bacterium]